ncbi:MAG: Gfo/Idh/MocA family oxidoreductase [Pirellulales bacterium]
MIRVGIVGLGFMGWVHWLSYQKLRGARVAAICSRDPRKRAGDWRDVRGNFGPRGEKVELNGAIAYAELDELLADPKIDLVDICLPPALHADAAVRSLRAGKHVLCEKPMALTLPDCQRMAAAAQKAKRQLCVGHVLPYFPEYDWALSTVRSGKYGKLRGGSFRRVIAEPKWLQNYWSSEHVGGPMLDLHVHDAHFIRLLFGQPTAVSTAGRIRNGLAEFWHSQFRFRNRDIVVETTSGTINQQGRPFNHGFEIHLEKATLAFEFAVIGSAGSYLCVPTLLDSKGRVVRPKMPDGDPMNAFPLELREVLRAVNEDKPSEILGANLAQDAIRICEAESASLTSGRPVDLK